MSLQHSVMSDEAWSWAKADFAKKVEPAKLALDEYVRANPGMANVLLKDVTEASKTATSQAGFQSALLQVQTEVGTLVADLSKRVGRIYEQQSIREAD